MVLNGTVRSGAGWKCEEWIGSVRSGVGWKCEEWSW